MKSNFFIVNSAAFISLLAALLIACSQSEPEAGAEVISGKQTPAKPQVLQTESYKTIQWTDLMPQDDLDALLNPPAYLDEIEDGSEEDMLSNQFMLAMAQASDDRYMQALSSTRIKPEFDNQRIRLPGFIVPLEFDEKQTLTRFFLVPFFGACIHVPPPPPNQIVYGVFEKGLEVTALHEPVWVTGILKTTLTENDVATSAYAMEVATVETYTE
ncbi:DUF3299 domain-containing protein [Nitrosomonas communis]|uniref:DUF3299 domain-containing protein n=1 Tax=Nitrosomonas communis TaxID=44574 RepID=UPI0026EFCC91|nr:DUF3299 domain-containing protein [Nitrosomonas communis]MCO6428655.1 DUF3299 domain-containing protein [Nitrosomonas communis]